MKPFHDFKKCTDLQLEIGIPYKGAWVMPKQIHHELSKAAHRSKEVLIRALQSTGVSPPNFFPANSPKQLLLDSRGEGGWG